MGHLSEIDASSSAAFSSMTQRLSLSSQNSSSSSSEEEYPVSSIVGDWSALMAAQIAAKPGAALAIEAE